MDGGSIAVLGDQESKQMLELNWYPDEEYGSGDVLDRVDFEADEAKAFLGRLCAKRGSVAHLLEYRDNYWNASARDQNGTWFEIHSSREGG